MVITNIGSAFIKIHKMFSLQSLPFFFPPLLYMRFIDNLLHNLWLNMSGTSQFSYSFEALVSFEFSKLKFYISYIHVNIYQSRFCIYLKVISWKWVENALIETKHNSSKGTRTMCICIIMLVSIASRFLWCCNLHSDQSYSLY